MGLFSVLLFLPLLGPIEGVRWLGDKLSQAAMNELLDEDRVRSELSSLQVRLDLGEITDEEYDGQETVLLQRLDAIREAKAEQGQTR